MPAKHVEAAQKIADEYDGKTPPEGQAPAAGDPVPPAADTPPPQEPAPPQAPSLTPSVASGEPPEGQPEDWQQKYLTLKGKFDSEVPRLSQDLRTAYGQINELNGRLMAVEQGQQPQPQPQPQPEVTLITDEDIENYGPELTDFIKRAATAVAQTMTAEVRAENQQLREQLQQVGAGMANVEANRYFSDLTQLVPDFREINVHPAFLQWLGEVDPVAGVSRQVFLNTAYEARDVQRTATIFNSFKTAAGFPPVVTPQPSPAPVVGQNPPQPQGQAPNGDGRSISPAAGGSGTIIAAGGIDGTHVWTGAEIRAFTNDILRGNFKGREADQIAIQQEIDNAIVQGRIQP